MEKQNLVKSKELTGSSLKWIAIITMLIDHIGAFILEPYMLGNTISDKNIMITIIPRLIGRLAFPIFTFLLVEGYMNTRNLKRYIFQMGIFALISEIPFDLASHGVILEFSYQNVFFTLFIGLFTIALFDKFKEMKHIKWLILISGMVIATILKTDYSSIGIVIIFVFYYFHDNKVSRNITIAPLLLLQITAILALIPIELYNGKRGKQNKFFFYIFYPAHLIILFLIRTMISIN